MLGAALSLGNELSASLGDFTLSTVGERLGDEPGELLGDLLSDRDAGEVSATGRTSTGRIARRVSLSLGDELSASLGAFSLSTVGERLEDEPGETLGKPLRDRDAGEISDTERNSTGRLARRSTFTRRRAKCFNDKLSP